MSLPPGLLAADLQNPTWKVAIGITYNGNILENLVGAMLLIRDRVVR